MGTGRLPEFLAHRFLRNAIPRTLDRAGDREQAIGRRRSCRTAAAAIDMAADQLVSLYVFDMSCGSRGFAIALRRTAQLALGRYSIICCCSSRIAGCTSSGARRISRASARSASLPFSIIAAGHLHSLAAATFIRNLSKGVEFLYLLSSRCIFFATKQQWNTPQHRFCSTPNTCLRRRVLHR